MSKHTPGPWVVDFMGTIGHIKSIATHPKGWTPTVCKYDPALFTTTGERASCLTEEETQANARLIAAAPDMADALRQASKILARVCCAHDGEPLGEDAGCTLYHVRAALTAAGLGES